MQFVSSITDSIKALVNKILEDERGQQVKDLLAIADKWRPRPTNYTYREEMANRIAYFHGSMEEDMNAELKRRFPQTYKELQKEQVNLPVVRKEYKDLAKVFLSTGQIYLVNENGDRDEGEEQDRFQDVMRTSRFYSNCKQADEYTQLCWRSLFKPWWDARSKRVRISIWPPHLVHIAPNPERWWDVDSAYAVLLELPGYEGLTRLEPRYEVWGIRDPEAAISTQKSTVHYVTSGIQDTQINSDDVNPFMDDGRSVYPFVWWQADETTDLYALGEEDCLTINRRVNSLLTDLVQAIHYKAFGVWVHTTAQGGNELGVKTISPNTVVDLAYGATLDNISPELPLREVKEIIDTLIRDRGMLKGLASSAMRTEKAAPESGYALEIRNKPLKEHRENMIEIYRPYVLESAKRVCIVHNTYSSDKINLKKYKIHWEPGEMQIPANPEEEGNRFTLEIASNVSSPADWYAKKAGVDRKTAIKEVAKRLLENERFTKKKAEPKFDNRFKQEGGENEQVEENQETERPEVPSPSDETEK